LDQSHPLPTTKDFFCLFRKRFCVLFIIRGKTRVKENTYRWVSLCLFAEELKKTRSGGKKCHFLFVYYESIKQELNRKLTYECRWDERPKVKDEGSTRLTYTGL
jgi:hypothetical protein